MDLGTLQSKVDKYNETLKSTIEYRKAWGDGLKDMISKTLGEVIEQTSLKAKVEFQDNIENLEMVILSLGRSASGISEKVDEDLRKKMIRSNGAILYQQLFNGKIMVLFSYPFLEGYGEPKPPRTVEILRPHELKQGFILRHIEEFLKEITQWEDFDDDAPAQKAIGFNSNMTLASDVDLVDD